MSHSSPVPPFAPPKTGFTGQKLDCRRGERLVFSGLDFNLAAGGALVLVGPNGSGKSSLLRVMAGLIRAESGTLSWDGSDLHEDPAAHRGRLHFIGHADALKPVLSAAEMLHFWTAMRGGTQDVMAPLTQFGLGAAAELPCRYLSAGQRRRLALARLIATPAPLWLLDEPTTGLDSEAAAQLLAAIAAHRRAGGCVVVSTHAALDLGKATQLSLADFRPRRTELSEEVA